MNTLPSHWCYGYDNPERRACQASPETLRRPPPWIRRRRLATGQMAHPLYELPALIAFTFPFEFWD